MEVPEQYRTMSQAQKMMRNTLMHQQDATLRAFKGLTHGNMRLCVHVVDGKFAGLSVRLRTFAARGATVERSFTIPVELVEGIPHVSGDIQPLITRMDAETGITYEQPELGVRP